MRIANFFKNECRSSIFTLIIVIIRFTFNKFFFGNNIIVHPATIIKGMRNINMNGNLKIGLFNTGFVHRGDKTFLNIGGKLNINGNYSIGRGCRIDVGNKAIINIEGGGFINANTLMVIMHTLHIGKDCAISWGCQFLDENFHKLNYEGIRKQRIRGIELGDRVWIGCNSRIYGGTKIPSGCVIAADSVVKGVFLEENCLIAGNPAKIVKRDISWEN